MLYSSYGCYCLFSFVPAARIPVYNSVAGSIQHASYEVLKKGIVIVMHFADDNQVSKPFQKKKRFPLGSSPSETTLLVQSKYFRPLARVGQTFLRTLNSEILWWKGDNQVLLRQKLCCASVDSIWFFFSISYKRTNH